MGLIGLDVFISKNLYKTGRTFGDVPEMRLLQEGAINADLLIIGSSRAEVHYNAAIIQNKTKLATYNLGIGGVDWNLIQFRLEQYLAKNKRPKYLIVNFDYNNLNRLASYILRDELLPYAYANQAIKNQFNVHFADTYIPGIRYAGHNYLLFKTFVHTLKNPPIASDKVMGFKGENIPWSTTGIPAATKISPPDIDVDGFFKYLTALQASGIKIMVVTPPFKSELIAALNNYDSVMQYYTNAFKEMGIMHYNYSTHPINMHQAYFYNYNHLNAKGADSFTNMVIRDVLEDIK